MRVHIRNSHFCIIHDWVKAKTQHCASECGVLCLVIVNVKRDGRLSSGAKNQEVNVTDRYASLDEWFDRMVTARRTCYTQYIGRPVSRNKGHRLQVSERILGRDSGAMANTCRGIAAEIKLHVTVGCSESLTGEGGRGQRGNSCRLAMAMTGPGSFDISISRTGSTAPCSLCRIASAAIQRCSLGCACSVVLDELLSQTRAWLRRVLRNTIQVSFRVQSIEALNAAMGE